MTRIGPKQQRHCGALLTTQLLLTLVGCQSGHIAYVQTSDDHQILIFKDGSCDSVYVADSAGVRAVPIKGNYLLDPKGRWLLLTDGWPGTYFTGNNLTLLRLKNYDQYETPLPLEVIQGLLRVKDENCRVPTSQICSDEQRESQRHVRFFFFDEAEIMIGPLGQDQNFWRWRPKEHGANDWCQLHPKEAAEHLSTTSVPFAAPLCGQEQTLPDYIVQFPSDGAIALRTIWIRPSGVPLELVRKNDAPLYWLYAIGTTIIAPVVGPFVDYHTGSIVNQVCCAIGVPMITILSAWHQASCDLDVDPTKLSQARKRLVRAIEQRQSQALNPDDRERASTPPNNLGSEAPPRYRENTPRSHLGF